MYRWALVRRSQTCCYSERKPGTADLAESLLDDLLAVDDFAELLFVGQHSEPEFVIVGSIGSLADDPSSHFDGLPVVVRYSNSVASAVDSTKVAADFDESDFVVRYSQRPAVVRVAVVESSSVSILDF